MTIDSTQSAEERQLQELFDETASVASEAQLARMSARAEQIPAPRRRKGAPRALLIPLAAAAAIALAIGGAAWWTQHRADTTPEASAIAPTAATITPTAPTVAPTMPAPTAVASVDRQPESDVSDPFEEVPVFPADPLAVLDGDYEGGDVGMDELDLLHGPPGGDDDAFWEEMERLMEEGG